MLPHFSWFPPFNSGPVYFLCKSPFVCTQRIHMGSQGFRLVDSSMIRCFSFVLRMRSICIALPFGPRTIPCLLFSIMVRCFLLYPHSLFQISFVIGVEAVTHSCLGRKEIEHCTIPQTACQCVSSVMHDFKCPLHTSLRLLNIRCFSRVDDRSGTTPDLAP